jgi:hypothetical protein
MKIRNRNEKVCYAGYLTEATGSIKQAIDNITYLAYPDLNKRTIAKLEEAIRILESAATTPIFKP